MRTIFFTGNRLLVLASVAWMLAVPATVVAQKTPRAGFLVPPMVVRAGDSLIMTATYGLRRKKDSVTYLLEKQITRVWKKDTPYIRVIELWDSFTYKPRLLPETVKNTMPIRRMAFPHDSLFNPPGTTFKDTLIRIEAIYPPTRWKLRTLKRQLRSKRESPQWSIGVSAMPGWASGATRIYARQYPDGGGLETRNANEVAIPAWAFSVSPGFRFGSNSRIALDGVRLRQGFEARYHTVDWKTGLPVPAPGIDTYKYERWGLGFLYSRGASRGYKDRVTLAFDAGAYALWDSGPEGKGESLRRQTFLIRGGLGSSISLADWLEVRLVPTVWYGLGSLNWGDVLRTNLFNYGVNIGMVLGRQTDD